jgi:hypothetical protein
MNDPFEKKVRAAVVAGWWVVLIAVAFLTLLWLLYLAVLSTHPAWLLTLWGPGVDWPFVQNVWFWAVAAFKFCVWLMIFAVLWLPASAIERIVKAVEPFAYDRVYGAFWDRIIEQDGKAVVQRSAQRYLRALRR